MRALDDVLALHTMRFHDEIVRGEELDVDTPGKGPRKQEVEMASQLVDSLHRKFDPTDYEDSYREAVLELIERKAKGEEIEAEPDEPEEETDDLMAALQASLEGVLMARTLWNGSLSFGLVNVPVRLTSAARDLDLHFRQLHEKDGAAIEQRRFCSEEDKEVDWEEVGRGYELDDGEQVVLTDDELASVAAAQDAHDLGRGVRRPRRGRPDLLRPPLVPGPQGRERGHAARLPAAGGGDGVHRPRGRSGAS